MRFNFWCDLVKRWLPEPLEARFADHAG